MDALSYELSKSIPLRSGEQILERVADLVGSAIGTNLWLILLDADRVQLQQMIEIERPGLSGEELAGGLANLFRGLACSAVVTVLERPGSEGFTPADREWARALHAACSATALELTGVLVSHSSGVRWLAEDDYLAE